jgi:hypothetical protein
MRTNHYLKGSIVSDHTEKRSIKERVKPHLRAVTVGAITGATFATICTIKLMNNRIPSALVKDVMKHGKTTILLTRSNVILDIALHQN